VTVPGQYQKLEEHIDLHRYYMGLEKKSYIPYEEAVAHWYDTVYLPIICIFHQQELLDDFPNRTEADLYLWLSEHRSALAEQMGGDVGLEQQSTIWLINSVLASGVS
jgi:hypothetical protein